MKSSKTTAVLVGVALLGLGGCDNRGAAAGNTNAGAITSGSAGSAENPAGKQLDTYVEAHNVFVGTFGFEEKAAAYRKADITHASPDGAFYIDAGWIGQGLDKLKAARAISGGAPELDAAADTLIASMGKVQAHLASLSTYYSGKKYLDDKLARGKAEDPQMLAELDTAEKDFARFNAVLDAAIDKRDQALLDTLKTADPLKYNTKLALLHAKTLIGLFNRPDDVKNAAIFTKGDAEVATIEKAIADAHQLAAKAGKADPSGLSSLTSMVGAYRTLKQGHDVGDLQSMVREYNQAVESTNAFGGVE